MAFTRQVTIRAPPKSVFQVLADVTLLEECTNWKITPFDDTVGEGFQWREARGVTRRVWTMTTFERRGLTYTATAKGLTLTVAAKKGGPGSCNVRMIVDGDEKAVARFEKTDGDRLDRIKAWLES